MSGRTQRTGYRQFSEKRAETLQVHAFRRPQLSAYRRFSTMAISAAIDSIIILYREQNAPYLGAYGGNAMPCRPGTDMSFIMMKLYDKLSQLFEKDNVRAVFL